MSNRYDKYFAQIKELAKDLRSNMTVHERMLWPTLKDHQIENIQFFPQKPIGEYIVDFYAPSINLVIEVDGCQHLASDKIETDKVRDEFLKFIGLTVMRFTNFHIEHSLDLVVEDIRRFIIKGKFSSGALTGLI